MSDREGATDNMPIPPEPCTHECNDPSHFQKGLVHEWFDCDGQCLYEVNGKSVCSKFIQEQMMMKHLVECHGLSAARALRFMRHDPFP